MKTNRRSQQRARDGGSIQIENTPSFFADNHKVDTAQSLRIFKRPANVTDLPKESAG